MIIETTEIHQDAGGDAVASCTRDIIVIGSSMGGIDALSSLVSRLPADLPAAILIVQHISPESPNLLGEILSKRGKLPAVSVDRAMPMKHGHIYLAPPDRHLLLTREGVDLTFGPRENRSRPAIDPLFRTAAVNFGSRVIGIVLTGMLGDGAAGLLAVEQCGGITLVQDPDDAQYPEMPSRALRAVPSARRITLDELPDVLADLVGYEAPASPAPPDALRREAQLTERAMTSSNWNQIPGVPSRFTCPECNGALQQVAAEGPPRFRCRVGHAYSGDDLVEDKTRAVEDALWVALQTLQERVDMLEAMAADNGKRGWQATATNYERKAGEVRLHVERLRDLLASLRP